MGFYSVVFLVLSLFLASCGNVSGWGEGSQILYKAERPPPPQVVQQELLMAAGESREYF
jgi:hypothetical protein